MKRALLIVFILTVVVFIAGIGARAQDSGVVEQTKFYRSMYNCQRGIYAPDSVEMFGRTISFEYRVLGLQNNKCHIRENMGGVVINCALPMSVARKYAQEGLRVIQQGQQGVGYSQYMTQINNDSKYCKINTGD